MNRCCWHNVYFSPTGNTLKVAKAITGSSGVSVHETDLSVPAFSNGLEENEVFLAVMPVFGGRIPPVAVERLSSFRGNGRKAVAVVVYGNRAYEDALLELKTVLEECGFQVIAAAAFIAEHSMIRKIAAGRPDSGDLKIAGEFGAGVMEKMLHGSLGPVQVPGNPEYKRYAGSSAHPRADERCTACGTCARECPVGAISPESPSGTDPDKCMNCMRCVSACPVNARSLPVPMLEAVERMLMENASEARQPEVFL